MGECWNCGATADDDWSCQACRTERGLAQDLADAGREIERLRAENGSWRSLDQIRLDLLRQSADELRRLQAKVDAWAKAFRLWDTTRPYPDELIDAEEALLAAATKEADRG